MANKVWAICVFVGKLAIRLTNHPNKLLEFYVVGNGTALHLAAYQGMRGAVELLLEAKADVTSTNHPLKMTPLHAAAVAGHH